MFPALYREKISHKERAETLVSAPQGYLRRRFASGVLGPYLAVDLLDQAPAVLRELLVLPDLFELLDREFVWSTSARGAPATGWMRARSPA